MRKTQVILLSGVGAMVVAGVLCSGCGGDDHNGPSGATITGNISAVNPPQARREDLSHRWLARLDSLVVGEAIAQATCPARHVFICVANGRDPIACEPVDSTDCRFSITLDPVGDFSSGGVSFFDDANQNGQFDQGELFAILTNQLVPLCEGTVATLNDVSANFATLTATAASVVKNPDTCAGTPTATPRATVTRTPTHVGTPGATHTPSGTITPGGTATPGATTTGTPSQTGTPTHTPTTYVAASSLNDPPSSWLALASGLGIVGLLVPRRRRRR